MIQLEELLELTQKKLFTKISEMYKDHTIIECKNSYILVQGEAPVMLLAHLDTVHEKPVKQICTTPDGNILMSPQGIGGDDRCGVYALVTIYEQSTVKPWLLFTCDEEKGGVGANKFCKMHKAGNLPESIDSLKMIVEIDRKGKCDAVYYDCENPDFEEYITSKGFKTAYGSFSDISCIAPEIGVAAVNLSSGYYNAHTLHEYINRRQLNGTIQKVSEIVIDAAEPDFPQYLYMRALRYPRFGGYSVSGFGDGLTVFRENPDLEGVPEDILQEYEVLLDFYTADELEEFRREYGDQVIHMLFESEIGIGYEQYWGDMID